MVSRDIIQRLLAIINETRSRVNTLESKENVLLTATQTLTNKTLTTPSIGDFTNAQHAHTNAASGGTIAHTSLTDLTTGDPHTQYALLAGRSGGQSLNGGTAANDDLTLQGTTNATRTTSYVIVQPNGGNVGIGTASPGSKFTVTNDIATGYIDTNTLTSGQWARISNPNTTSGVAATLLFEATGSGGGNGLGTISGVNTGSGSLALTFGTRDNSSNVIERVRIAANGNVGIGTTSPSTRLDIDAGALELAEMTAPAAGAANTVRIYAVDNGGKTQLMALFSSGAAQQLAIQP